MYPKRYGIIVVLTYGYDECISTIYSLLGCDIYQWMSPGCKVVCFLASSVNKAKVTIIPKTR